MNGTVAEARARAEALVSQLLTQRPPCDLAICPPFVHLGAVGGAVKGHGIALGAQDCSVYDNGAYTGDVSASMLTDLGCTYTILGHSERRQYFGETDATVLLKARRVMTHHIVPIICVGETLEERKSGQTLKVVTRQLEQGLPEAARGDAVVIAYEPVWAIGTGLTASVDEIAEVHGTIRKLMNSRLAEAGLLRIIYGGSVKPDNAGEILAIPDVDGALVGGASLLPASFLGIAQAAPHPL